MSERDEQSPRAEGPAAGADGVDKAAAARARKEAEEAAKPDWERDPQAPTATDAEGDPLVVALRGALPDAVLAASTTGDELTLVIERESIAAVGRTLRDEQGFALLVDVCGVDYPDRDPERFEIVYHLYSLDADRYVRLKVRTREDREVPTVSGVWRGANWCEREVYDMFGIRFSDHPDLTRILLWDGFTGYPLRKDFPVEGIDTGAAIYPELYREESGPIAGTGTGWKPPAESGAEPAESDAEESE